MELTVELVSRIASDHLYTDPVALSQSQNEAHAVAVPAVSGLAAEVVVGQAVHRLTVADKVHGWTLSLVFAREGLHAKHVHTC